MALVRVKELLNEAVTATGTGDWIDLRELGEVVALQLDVPAAAGATYAVEVQTSPDQAIVRDVVGFPSVTGAATEYLERMVNDGGTPNTYVLQWDIAHFARWARVDWVRTAGTATLVVHAFAEGGT